MQIVQIIDNAAVIFIGRFKPFTYQNNNIGYLLLRFKGEVCKSVVMTNFYETEIKTVMHTAKKKHLSE